MPTPMRRTFREKVWGSTHLSPWFPDSDRNIGEVWFEHDQPLPILVKFLFTSEKLSVQVHPDDEYAGRHESSRGKTEMWHVLSADPDSPGVAAGLREQVSAEKLRELASSGEIEALLNWIPVQAGDNIFVPAGTIHAIGPGLVICEIQQNSDVTYRLYDYGRRRELHLAQAADVAIAGPLDAPDVRPGFLAWSEYFAVQELQFNSRETEIVPKQDRFELLIAVEGRGRLSSQDFSCGEAWHVASAEPPFRISADGQARFLRVYVP